MTSPGRLILAALLVAAVASPAAAANPSFPCSGALTVSERAICSDDDLAALDRKVATAYRNKSDGLPIESANALEVVVQGLVVTQKAWIAHRNSCGADRSCIRNAYVIRLRALTAGDNAKDVPCRDTVGSKQAAAYVKECIAVATETHPPCNADNFCELIVSHNIYRCAGLGDQGPKSCATYRSK